MVRRGRRCAPEGRGPILPRYASTLGGSPRPSLLPVTSSQAAPFLGPDGPRSSCSPAAPAEPAELAPPPRPVLGGLSEQSERPKSELGRVGEALTS